MNYLKFSKTLYSCSVKLSKAMYSPFQLFPNTCIYVSLKTLIFVLAFLPFNPKILKAFPDTFPIKMKPYNSYILNAQQKEKKNN